MRRFILFTAAFLLLLLLTPFAASAQSKIYRVAEVDSPPAPLIKLEPSYTEEARVAKIRGTVTLECVINDKGLTEDVRVAAGEPKLGYGLEEKAVEAVRQWKFRPAMKAGAAVAVQAKIKTNFELH